MYAFDSRVRYSECDETGTLSIVSIIDYLQDCSTFQGAELGRSFRETMDDGFAWLIAAWQIEVSRLPRFFEPIRVCTWCYGFERSLAYRNFLMETADGETLVRADSIWFPYAMETGRILRIPESEQVYIQGDERLDMPKTNRKVKAQGPFVEAGAIAVSEQLIDTNGHVNNAQYVALAIDALEELGEAFEPSRICVQYKAQARLGDTIIPHVHGDGEARVVDLAGEGDISYAVVRLEMR